MISEAITFQGLSVVCSETHSLQLFVAAFILLGVTHCEIDSFKIHSLLVVKFSCHSLQYFLVISFKIHSLRADKNIIYRTVTSFFLLRSLTNLKIKEYLFSRSPINCCIHFVRKSNENLQYPCEIHPHQAPKFALVSDGWVLQSVYFKVLNFWSKFRNIYRMKDATLYMYDTTINLHFIKERIY